ncbi:hypothetical protein [Paenochrobactrum glaciei]
MAVSAATSHGDNARMWVNSFVNRGIEDDDRKLAAYGIDPLASESLPYYVRWIRQDIIGIFYMLNMIVVLLILIAIPLWMIALR